jgi:4-hydroxy-2-oxoheptanedioate aldolase
LRGKRVAFGTGIYTYSPALVEIAGYTGFDYVFIDTEHTAVDWQTLESLVRAADVSGASSLIRVQENNEALVRKALEIGADGILVPHVNTAEEAKRAVQYAKFPPMGVRGAAGLVRSGGYAVSNWPEYIEFSNRETVVAVMAEEPEALENMREIVSVKGVDIISFGPADFSITSGLAGKTDHPRVVGALERIVAEARRKGLAVMSPVSQPYAERAKALIDKGVRVITMGHDISVLSARWKEILGEAKKLA